jgi:hypothetical protein
MSRLIFILIVLTTFSLTSVAKACDVAICDIPAQMTELRAKNGDQRGMYAINLKAQYKDATDTAILLNLQEAGTAMKQLFTELKDEDWVVRAASDLVNHVVLSLAKYSEINGEALAGYYRILDGQTSRYAMITHWQSQLATIEVASELNELVVFAANARERSTEVGDEDWVGRAATSLITDITIKLTSLDPVHEGVYDVAMTEASLALGTLAFDKMAVLDSSSSKNLVVVFINSKLRVTAHSFTNAEIKGNEVTGLVLSNGDISKKVSFTINRTTGAVSGVIESTKSDAIEFSGSQLFSTRQVFAGKTPRVVTQNDVLATLSGQLAGISGKLAIKSFLTNVYSATFTSDNGSIVMSFQGKFFPKTGVLSLTSADKLKLVVSLREKNGVEAWSGFSFSTVTGKVAPATFAPKK